MAYGEARTGFFNVGRLTRVTNAAAVLKTDYDALGRAVKQVQTLGGVDYAVERRYDIGGFLRGITYPDGDAVGTPSSPLGYDQAGRLTSIPGIVTEVLYDAAGRPTRQANANGTLTERGYSATRGFLTGIRTGGPALIQDLTYSPDATGLLRQVTSPFQNEGWSYAYDDLHRLTSATSLSTPAESQTWSLDAIGRITYNSRVGSYAYSPSRPHAPAAVAGNPYTYDANGNLTSGGGRTPQWNVYNKPTEISGAQFFHDGLGERVKKTSALGTSLYPMGDDYEITNGVVTKYITVPGLGVVAKRRGSETFWMHTDRLGSIQAITDDHGAPVWRKTYRPYGEAIAQSTAHQESRGWIDQRQDDETGLTYLHARYYDPSLGVFLSPDPLHPSTQGVGWNRYGYALGNPLNGSDRSGLAVYTTDGEKVTAMETIDVIGGPWKPSAFPGYGYNPGRGRTTIPRRPSPPTTPPQTPVPPPQTPTPTPAETPNEPNECPQGVTGGGAGCSGPQDNTNDRKGEGEQCDDNTTLLFGVSGAFTPFVGLEGSVGGAVEFNHFTPKDAGSFVSGGPAYGWNVSGDVFVGYVNGTIQGTVEGDGGTVSWTGWGVTLTAIHNSKGEFVGGSLGAGPGLKYGGASHALTTTRTGTIKGMLNTLDVIGREALRRCTPRPQGF